MLSNILKDLIKKYQCYNRIVSNTLSINYNQIKNFYISNFSDNFDESVLLSLKIIYNDKLLLQYLNVLTYILYDKCILLDEIYCPKNIESGMFNFILHLYGMIKYQNNISDSFINKYHLNNNYFKNSLRHYNLLFKLYKLDTGKFGIHENNNWWIKSHIENTLFTFGSLEVHMLTNIPNEIKKYCSDNNFNSDDIINIEWLCDDRLIIENIDKDLKDATNFIKMYYGKYPKLFIGKSWFFNPYLKDYLPNSNMAKLLHYFTYIADCQYNKNNQAGLFWIFGKQNCNIYEQKIDNSIKHAILNIVDDRKKLIEGIAGVKVNEYGQLQWKRNII